MKSKNLFSVLLLSVTLFINYSTSYAENNAQVVKNKLFTQYKEQSKEAKIIASSRALLSKIKDVSFEFRQFSSNESAMNSDAIVGSVFYLAPEKFVIKQKKGALEQSFYCNGKTLFIYTPSQKQAITDKLSNWNKNSPLPLDLFSLDKFWSVLDREFLFSAKSLLNENACLVTFASKKNNAYFIDVLIDAKSYLPVSIKVRNSSFAQSTQFSNYKINTGILKSTFIFKPAKDVDVIDLSE